MAAPGGVEVSRASVRILPDTSHLFEDLKADLDKIEKELSVDIKASVDAAELTASAREAVAEAQAAAGDIDIKANVDTSQVGEAERALSSAASASSGLLGNFSALGAGAGILSLALIPLTAAMAGLVAALAAPLAISAGGVTIFGFLAGFAVKDTLAQLKQIDTLHSKLDGLTKGTTEYQQTLVELKAAQAGLTPAQKAFADALDKVKGAFASLPQGVLLKPLTDALGLLARVLPKLTPVIAAVSGVFDDLVGKLDKVVTSPGFKGFIQAFAHDLSRDLRAFAKIAGNVFIGLGGLFSALDDTLSKGVIKGLENLTGRFADFGRDAKKNEGLKSFVNYVKQNLPIVGKLVGGTFDLIGKAFHALAGPGHLVLEAVTGVVTQLNKLSGIAGPLAAALGTGGLAAFFGGPEVGLAVGGVVGLVAAFKELYDRSKPLQRIIRDLGDYFQQTWLPLIQKAAQQVVPAFQGAIKDISDTIRNNKGLFEVLGKAIIAIGSTAVIGAIVQVALTIKLIGKAFKFGTEAVKLWADVTLTILRLVVQGVGDLVAAILSQFGTIVDSAAAAFGWMPGIGGKVKAAQAAFHQFTANVTGDINEVGDNLASLQSQIDEVGKSHPKFRIDSNTLELISEMHQLQAFKFKDKNLKITTQIEQQIERVTAPGGGQGHPGDAKLKSGNSGSSAGPQIHVDKMYAGDTNDILRKSGNLARSRAGGGVLLPPPLVPSFGGA